MENILHPTIFKEYMTRNLSDYKGGDIQQITYLEENDEYVVDYKNIWFEDSRIWISTNSLKFK